MCRLLFDGIFCHSFPTTKNHRHKFFEKASRRTSRPGTFPSENQENFLPPVTLEENNILRHRRSRLCTLSASPNIILPIENRFKVHRRFDRGLAEAWSDHVEQQAESRNNFPLPIVNPGSILYLFKHPSYC